MILLQPLLFLSALLPALSAPDLPHALAKWNEAKARLAANRAKLRANSARFANHHRPSTPNRAKRQYGAPGYAPPALPQPAPAASTQYVPPPTYSAPEPAPYEDDEPVLVHICSVEDDSYERAANEEDDDDEMMDFHAVVADSFARENSEEEEEEKKLDRKGPKAPLAPKPTQEAPTTPAPKPAPRHPIPQSKSPKSGTPGEPVTPSSRQAGLEDENGPLSRAFQELSEVRKMIDKYEEEHFGHPVVVEPHQRPNSKFAGSFFAKPNQEVNSQPHQEVSTSQVPSHDNPQHLDHEKKNEPSVNLNSHALTTDSLHHSLQKVIPAVNNLEEQSRDADPHHHFHSHHHSILHNHGSLPAPAVHTQVHSGHVLPQTQVVVPGLNLNINQNQLHSGLNQNPHTPSVIKGGIGHGLPTTHGVFPSSHVTTTHDSVFPGSEPIIYPRQSNDEHPGRDAEADAYKSRPIPHHSGVGFNQPLHHGLNQNQVFSGGQIKNQHFVPIKHHGPGQHQIPGPVPNLHHGFNNQNHLVHTSKPFSHQPISHHGSFRDAEDAMEPNLGSIMEEPTETEVNDARESSTEDDEDDEIIISDLERTHKKKKKKFVPIYPTYSSYNSYSHMYRENEESDEKKSSVETEGTSFFDSREASPTHKKKKKLVPIYIQPYPSYNSYGQHYGRYREAEEGEESVSAPHETEEDFGSREASPTHKKKKKMIPIYIQPYYPPSYPSYGQHYGRYREAGENQDEPVLDEILSELLDARDAKSPLTTQPDIQDIPDGDQQAEENLNEPRQVDLDAADDLVSSNYLLNFPTRFSEQYKRSLDTQLDQILGKEREIVDSLASQSKNDDDLKLIAGIGNGTLSHLEEQHKKISKRSIPLTRLITDPRVKLDVPQTLENFGTVTKNAFEDERAPMYHVKNLVGSSKNALLSAMRIPPQNVIIPSDYEIVRSSEISRSRSTEDVDDEISNTFKRVGEIVRESIHSGQEAASHINDAAHSMKNILHTARRSAPKLLIPYSKVPALQKTPNKAVLITPRILDLAAETSRRNSADYRTNFLPLGNLIDAAGISKPDAKQLDLQRFVFEPRKLTEEPIDDHLAHLYGKLRKHYDDDAETVSEAISTLEDAKISVGAKNLRDFLMRMKNQLTDFVVTSPPKHKKKYSDQKKKQQEMGKFIETLFDGDKRPKNGEVTLEVKNGEGQDEVVGERLYLAPELLKPFMGRATEGQLHHFLQENGDEGVENVVGHQEKEMGRNQGNIVGAINPLMFERLYNESVKVKNNNESGELFHKTVQGEIKEPGSSSFGNVMKNTPNIDAHLETYNNDEDSDYIETQD